MLHRQKRAIGIWTPASPAHHIETGEGAKELVLAQLLPLAIHKYLRLIACWPCFFFFCYD